MGANILQKLLRICPAFWHSLSMVVGRKLCEPNLLAIALMGPAAFWPNSVRMEEKFLREPSCSASGASW